jgi:hypothetical protein
VPAKLPLNGSLMEDGSDIVGQTTRTALPLDGKRDAWLEQRLKLPRRRAGPIESRPAPLAFLAGRRGRLPPLPAGRPTRPTAFHAGRRFKPSARGWTRSNAGEGVIRSPDPHRTARTRGGRGWRARRIGLIEPNAGAAPLYFGDFKPLGLRERFYRRGEFEPLGLDVPPPFVGGGPG